MIFSVARWKYKHNKTRLSRLEIEKAWGIKSQVKVLRKTTAPIQRHQLINWKKYLSDGKKNKKINNFFIYELIVIVVGWTVPRGIVSAWIIISVCGISRRSSRGSSRCMLDCSIKQSKMSSFFSGDVWCIDYTSISTQRSWWSTGNNK